MNQVKCSRGLDLNVTAAATVASAIAAVVATVITVATFILRFRKPPANSGTVTEEAPAVPTKEIAGGPVGGPAQPIETRKTHWLRWAAISLSVGVIAGLVVLLLASVLSTRPTVSLTSPASGTAVSRTKEFHVKGTVNHLGNDTIWLADYDGGYAVDDEATVFANDTWEATDSNVGNPDQALPFPLTVRVILADTQCAKRLQQTMDSNADYITVLPGGCTVVGDVNLKVTAP
jgi:hypothetical protein